MTWYGVAFLVCAAGVLFMLASAIAWWWKGRD